MRPLWELLLSLADGGLGFTNYSLYLSPLKRPYLVVLLRALSSPLSTEIITPFAEKCRKKRTSAYASHHLGGNIVVRALKEKWKKKLAVYSARSAIKKDTCFACCLAADYECKFANGFPSGAIRTVPSKQKFQYGWGNGLHLGPFSICWQLSPWQQNSHKSKNYNAKWLTDVHWKSGKTCVSVSWPKDSPESSPRNHAHRYVETINLIHIEQKKQHQFQDDVTSSRSTVYPMPSHSQKQQWRGCPPHRHSHELHVPVSVWQSRSHLVPLRQRGI